jgi:hypothetical protein
MNNIYTDSKLYLELRDKIPNELKIKLCDLVHEAINYGIEKCFICYKEQKNDSKVS